MAGGSSAGPYMLLFVNNTMVTTEPAYAPSAMKPGWEQENSPMYPLMTLRLKVSITAMSVILTTIRR
jgi:hypothetical protein